MTFEYRISVRFEHCDPAGIVFYPRYFGMLAAAASAWLTATTGWNERHLHGMRGECIHPQRMHCHFQRPSRLGDVLDIRLDFAVADSNALHADFALTCGDESRMTGELELAYLALRPEPHATALPARLLDSLAGGTATNATLCSN